MHRGVPPPLPWPAEGELRRWPRAPYIEAARLISRPIARTSLRASCIIGRTADISEGGVLVLAQWAPRVDAVVSLQFRVPEHHERVSLEAQVRWTRWLGVQTAIGLEFLAVPPDVHAAIARYVRGMTPPTNMP